MRGNLVRGLNILSAVLLLLPMSALAEPIVVLPDLIFTEVKVRNGGGLNEFIEIHNPGIEPVNLNNFFISYVNTPTPALNQQYDKTVVIGTGLLEAGKNVVLAKDNLSNAQELQFRNLSDEGGTLRITDNSDNTIDQFSWSSTFYAFRSIQYLCTSESCYTNKEQSFARVKDETGSYIMENPEWSLIDPTPESAALLPAPEPEPVTEPEPEPETEPVPDQTTNTEDLEPEQPVAEEPEPAAETPNITLLPLQITELLPNPAPPLTDTLDEFVEIYNPNDSAVDAGGYKVQTGSTYSYSFELSNVAIPARGYITVTSGNTNLSLANTGGKARLLDGSGVVVSETSAYSEAPEGQAWANITGAWQWTASPTPGAENILTAVLTAAKTSAKKTTAAKPKASATKAKAKKASAKTASAKKSAKKASALKGNTDTLEKPEEPEIVPVHTGVLAIIGGLTLVYAGYEYRHDVLNRLHRFRRYRETRRAARGQSSGR